MNHRALAFGLIATLVLAGCALAPALPPLNRGLLNRPPTMAPPPANASARTHNVVVRHGPIEREYNAREGVTRVSTATHKGAYFRWIQRPRVTFFYVVADSTPTAAPSPFYLVISSQSPAVFHNNRLTLTCDGEAADTFDKPTSQVVPDAFTTSHDLMFSLSPSVFDWFTACSSGEAEVGGVRAQLTSRHFDALRALAAQRQLSN